MKEEKYINWLLLRRQGALSEDQHRELDQWLQHPEAQAIARSVERLWQETARYKESFSPDIEAGLLRLKARLALESAVAQQAAPRPLRARRRRIGLGLAAAVALILITWIGFRVWGDTQAGPWIVTGPGETRTLVLPDRSEVTLNENSRLRLDARFETQPERVVFLEGEAYFQISKDINRSFRVQTEETAVEVLGTAFNLRAYPGERFTEVEVEEGRVSFRILQSEVAITLDAKQTGVFDHEQLRLYKEGVAFPNAQYWRTRRLDFRDDSLRKVISTIQRHEPFTISVSDERLLDCPLTLTFEHDPPDSILQTIALSVQGTIRKTGENSYELIGGSCR